MSLILSPKHSEFLILKYARPHVFPQSATWTFTLMTTGAARIAQVIIEKGNGRKERFAAREKLFFTSTWLRLSPGRSQPSVRWVYEVLPPRLKQVEFEADHSPSSISRKSIGKATFLLLRKSYNIVFQHRDKLISSHNKIQNLFI